MSTAESDDDLRQHNSFIFKIRMMAYIIGIILAELYIFFDAFGIAAFKNNIPSLFIIISAVAGVLILICFVYKYWRVAKVLLLKIDLLVLFIVGCVSCLWLFYNNQSIFWKEIVSNWNLNFVNFILALPCWGIVFLIINYIISHMNISVPNNDIQDKGKAVFVRDNEIGNSENDKFFNEHIGDFAKMVHDQVGPFVFGIEGKWGVGKTSFAKLSMHYLKENYKNDTLVFWFNPLRYDDSKNILDSFVEGLVSTINSYHYSPELSLMISDYWHLISKYSTDFSIVPFKFSLQFYKKDLNDILNKIRSYQQNSNFDIIVIIDDLDRLDFNNIKRILFLMRNIFRFPHLKFIICYDLDNITWSAQKTLLSSNGDDVEKIKEFFDKFVDYPLEIIIPSKKIHNFIDDLEKLLVEHPDANSILWHKMVGGIKMILESKDYIDYIPFFTIPRKIKRLFNLIINTSRTKEIVNEFDIDPIDLINLLLIYINYPHIFKDIYYSETKFGVKIFSLIRNIKDNHYDINPLFKKYLDGKSSHEKLLLNAIFNKYFDTNNMDDRSYYSLACFNENVFNGKVGNLERYLNLIVEGQYPKVNDQAGTYFEIVNKKILGQDITLKSLQEIFKPFDNDEKEILWGIITNIPGLNYGLKKLNTIIRYAIDELTDRPIINGDGFVYGTYHTHGINNIVYLLDKIPSANIAVHRDVRDDGEQLILNKIFNENDGILKLLQMEDISNVIKILDLLLFTERCNISHVGDIFNVSDALFHKAHPGQSINGLDTDYIAKEAQRELSQITYKTFKDYFKGLNILSEIDNLPKENFICKDMNLCNKNLTMFYDRARYSLKNYLINRLGNPLFGCGYYDLEGTDNKHQINKDFSLYLVDNCFNVKNNNHKNGCNFIEFMLYSNENDISGQVVLGNNLARTIDKDILIKYWQDNCQYYLENLNSYQGEIAHINGVNIPYKSFLDNLFKKLDMMISDKKE